LKPQCILIHENFKILQRRSRWVCFRPSTKSIVLQGGLSMAYGFDWEKFDNMLEDLERNSTFWILFPILTATWTSI